MQTESPPRQLLHPHCGCNGRRDGGIFPGENVPYGRGRGERKGKGISYVCGTACSITNWTEPYKWSALGLSSLLWNMMY